MCKNSENGAKLPISRKYGVEKRHGGHGTGGTGFARSPALASDTTSARANRGHARWRMVRFWETARRRLRAPKARARSNRATSRPALGRVNASFRYSPKLLLLLMMMMMMIMMMMLMSCAQLLTANECRSNPCRNGATCIDQYNGFLCQCTPGWQGPACDQDVNECSTLAGTDLGCQNAATCINTQGSFRSVPLLKNPALWFVLCKKMYSSARRRHFISVCN